MKYQLAFAALAASSMALMPGDGSTTNNIKFQGLPGPYSYQRAGSIDVSSGTATCPLTSVQANGPLAPLTNEMHTIFRGPLVLHKFAVYQPKAGASKRDSIRESPIERRGRMGHLAQHKKRAHNHEKRAYGDMVTATINGQVVTFADNWSPHATLVGGDAPVDTAPSPTHAAAPVNAIQEEPASTPAAASAGSSPAADVSSTSDIGTSTWTRSAFFDKDSATTENLVFTANNNFVMGLGFTQGYVGSDGVSQAQGPQPLSGTIPDNYEVIVSSASVCSSSDNTGGCAVVAPGSAAHHGYGGDRVVIMEYTMPESMSSAANKYTGNSANTNLPAIWSLGSDTVNIAQYGLGPDGACSGWKSGAGEFDIHEILPGGNPDIGYASFHMGDHYSGTPPSGFARPTDPSKTQKLAYVLSGSYAGIHILGSNFDIDGELSPDDVNSIVSGGSVAGNSAVKTSLKVANAGAPAYQASKDSDTFDVILSS